MVRFATRGNPEDFGNSSVGSRNKLGAFSTAPSRIDSTVAAETGFCIVCVVVRTETGSFGVDVWRRTGLRRASTAGPVELRTELRRGLLLISHHDASL
jgi:hypothetical protein